MSWIHLLLARFGAALTAPFGPVQGAIVLGLLGFFGLVTIPQALASGLLRPPWRQLTALSWLRLAAALMLMPSLLEEGIFRVLLLPRGLAGLAPLEQLAWAGLSVGLFVLYHPLAGRLWYPQGRRLFDQARFLVPCGLLGAVCVIAYASTGSLWAPVLIHWFTVLIWLGPADGGRDLTEWGSQG
ncbi:MAG: CPBP family glutamic-type intramembrane protease [Synechococcaceae cyanobacterium ELA739]